MESLTPQERFNQLLSFLKDPENRGYKRVENLHGIWSLSFPDLSLEDVVWLEERKHSAAILQDIREEAIEIMESEMFSQGCLKGNQRIPDIIIDRLDCFILKTAAAYKIAKTF